jgi:uncharacterized protein YbbC (DUF1343 family)
MTRANIVRNIINDDGYYYTKHSVLEIVNVIFDEHEADIKDKDKEIERLESRVYALENDTILQNMEQRLIDISLVIDGKLTSKDNK